MRPCGPARQAVVSTLEAQGRGALRDLVARTGLTYTQVRQILSDCVRAGAVTYRLERRPHSKRPVAVYEPAPTPMAPPQPDLWQPLAAAWHP